MRLDDFFMNTIYTVSSIMFSIGLGLIVTFNLQGVKNKTYIKKIRQNLKNVRNKYILYFSISTICLIIDKYFRDMDNTIVKESIISLNLTDTFKLSFNIAIFLSLLTFYSIIYFIVNFLTIQKLNEDIFDKLNK